MSKHRAYTAEDYWSLPDGVRAELIDGELYDMAPPSWTHQQIAFGIARAFADYIDAHGGPCKVCPAPVAVNLDADETTWVEPDVSVVCDPEKISDRGVEGAPDLVVEVVSPSSVSMDYFIKASRYKDAGVAEYWIIDPSSRYVTKYRFQQTGAAFMARYSFDEPVPVSIWGDDLAIRVADYE